MAGARGTQWGDGRRCVQVFDGKKVRKFDHLEDYACVGGIILKYILKKSVCRTWIRLIWMKAGTNSGLLWTWRWTSKFQIWDKCFFLSKRICSTELLTIPPKWSNRTSSEEQNLDLRSWDHWRWRVVSSVQDKAIVPFLHWRTSKSALLSGGEQKAATIWKHRAATVLLQTAVSSGVQLTTRK